MCHLKSRPCIHIFIHEISFFSILALALSVGNDTIHNKCLKCATNSCRSLDPLVILVRTDLRRKPHSPILHPQIRQAQAAVQQAPLAVCQSCSHPNQSLLPRYRCSHTSAHTHIRTYTCTHTHIRAREYTHSVLCVTLHKGHLLPSLGLP